MCIQIFIRMRIGFKLSIHNITPVIPEGLDRGVPNGTPTFCQLFFLKSHVIGGEPIAINRAQIQTP